MLFIVDNFDCSSAEKSQCSNILGFFALVLKRVLKQIRKTYAYNTLFAPPPPNRPYSHYSLLTDPAGSVSSVMQI